MMDFKPKTSKMHFLRILVLVLSEVSLSVSAPVDATIVQVQQWGVVGTQRVVKQVLLNGVSLTGTSQEAEAIIQTVSPDALLPILISVDQTSVLRNHTVLRSRECILEGSRVHWSDRVFCDGKVYLTLDHTDTWTTHVPGALPLKVLLDQDAQHTKTERTRLGEACIKLMREIRLSQEQSVPGTPLTPMILIPVLAFLVLTGLIIISLLLSKKQGSRLPGGVVGSIIHYPKDMTEAAPETKAFDYRAL